MSTGTATNLFFVFLPAGVAGRANPDILFGICLHPLPTSRNTSGDSSFLHAVLAVAQPRIRKPYPKIQTEMFLFVFEINAFIRKEQQHFYHAVQLLRCSTNSEGGTAGQHAWHRHAGGARTGLATIMLDRRFRVNKY